MPVCVTGLLEERERERRQPLCDKLECSHHRRNEVNMHKLTVGVLGLVCFTWSAFTINGQSDLKVIRLSGRLNCGTGSILFSKGELAKQEFSNLDSAQTALTRFYETKGVNKLLEILNDTCKIDEEKFEFPEDQSGRAGTAEYRPKQSLLVLEKKKALITFTVSDDDGQRANPVAYMDKMETEKHCRPISSVCWKCVNGKIICLTPKL